MKFWPKYGMVNDIHFQNSAMELFRHLRGLSAVAPSSSSVCFDCARLLYLVKGWENLRELGKLSRAPFQNFNSSSHLVLLLHVFWVQRCSWPAASPSGQPSPLLCTLGMCSQNACFPLHHHPPLGAPRRNSVLAFPLPVQGEAWAHRLLSHA